MYPSEQAIMVWLWMKAAAHALADIEHACRNNATPSEDDRLHKPFSETCQKSYQYALENWDQVVSRMSTYSGSYCGHGRYYLGYDVTIQSRKVTAKYRETEVTVTMSEIKHLIEYMLTAPEMEERQLTMLKMLAEHPTK